MYRLVELADYLDSKGLFQEANTLDNITFMNMQANEIRKYREQHKELLATEAAIQWIRENAVKFRDLFSPKVEL